MQVTGGGGYGCEMEVMTSGRTWWIRVCDRDGYRCAFGEEVKGGLHRTKIKMGRKRVYLRVKLHENGR